MGKITNGAIFKAGRFVEIKSLRRILQASGYNDLEHNASGHNALEHIASEHDLEQTSGNVSVSASEQAVFTESLQSLQSLQRH